MSGKVLLLGGPPAAGKSSVAEAWASSRPSPTAHLSAAAFLQFVRSGLRHPQRDGWDEEAANQYVMARRIVLAAIREYTAAGIDVVVDDGMFPREVSSRYALWAEGLHGVDHRLLILLPDLQTCLARNEARQGLHRLPEDLVRRFHALSAEWTATDVRVIDNRDQTIRETVNAVEAILASR